MESVDTLARQESLRSCGADREQRETVAVGSSGVPSRERAKALSY